jgi:aquaporin Z
MNGLPLLSEFLGTFLLLMSILATGNALVIGGTLGLLVLLLGGVSGCHLNPAVSLAMLLKGSMGTMDFVTYTAVQLAGATAALYAYQVLA